MSVASPSRVPPNNHHTQLNWLHDALTHQTHACTGAELDSELEARQQQSPESLRGVYQQVIKLVDTMVQAYLSTVRRTLQRMTNLIERRHMAHVATPRESPNSAQSSSNRKVASAAAISADERQTLDEFASARQSVLDQVHLLSKRMHEFTAQWASVVGKQQSPLIDRIPPRGVELWRDFWDTVRRQVRRINQEFWQLSQDMTRMLTGRLQANSNNIVPTRAVNTKSSLFYSSADDYLKEQFYAPKQLQEFYDKMSVALREEQRKMDFLNEQVTREHLVAAADNKLANGNNDEINLIDEQDDPMTKDELTRNPGLRQQIQQEISVFGSIFDIMQTFIQRLRESANNMIRDVIERPGASANNNNDPVTPGPSVKPQVDKLLDETIDSQRNINSQAKPVLIPSNRPVNRG